MAQNPYPAGSTPFDLAMVSKSNFSFENKKKELDEICFCLSKTRINDFKKIVKQISDSLPAVWLVMPFDGVLDEIMILSNVIDLQPDMTSNDPPALQGICSIFVKMLPRVSPDSIHRLRKKNEYLMTHLPPQVSKDSLQSWYNKNEQVLKIMDSEPTNYDDKYSYRIKCLRLPVNDSDKKEYQRIMAYLNRLFKIYED